LTTGGGRPQVYVKEKRAGAMPKIEIYTQFMCPYCARAERLLTSKGVAYREIDVTMDAPTRAVMRERASGRTSVPQIFIDGRHIGGSDDLAALDQTGELDVLLGRPAA
jgi:glutaredoxin 3